MQPFTAYRVLCCMCLLFSSQYSSYETDRAGFTGRNLPAIRGLASGANPKLQSVGFSLYLFVFFLNSVPSHIFRSLTIGQGRGMPVCVHTTHTHTYTGKKEEMKPFQCCPCFILEYVLSSFSTQAKLNLVSCLSLCYDLQDMKYKELFQPRAPPP